MGGAVQATQEASGSLGIAVDGAHVCPWLSAFAPLRTDVLSQAPWSCTDTHAIHLLDWLFRSFSKRPLLAITARPLAENDGAPLRGLSFLGSGVALVSSWRLGNDAFVGVARHEVAHALGLRHCGRWDCALSERPHPMSLSDRPPDLCPACKDLWDGLCRGLAP